MGTAETSRFFGFLRERKFGNRSIVIDTAQKADKNTMASFGKPVENLWETCGKLEVFKWVSWKPVFYSLIFFSLSSTYAWIH